MLSGTSSPHAPPTSQAVPLPTRFFSPIINESMRWTSLCWARVPHAPLVISQTHLMPSCALSCRTAQTVPGQLLTIPTSAIACCQICQALEPAKNAVDERVRGLQTEILGAGEGGGGADGSGGSEALQKELLLTLTELAKASTEVPLGLMHLDPRCGSATDLEFFAESVLKINGSARTCRLLGHFQGRFIAPRISGTGSIA